MESLQQAANQEIVIENMGVLDLMGTKAEDLAGVSLIRNVGVVIVPESLSGALMNIRQQNIGSTCLIPQTTGKVKVLSGEVSIGGEVFANSTGSPEDILVIAGEIMITSPIEKCGFKHFIAAGEILVPKESAAAFGDAVTSLTGQVAYYSNTGNVRIFNGRDTLSNEFFDFVEGKLCMVITGDYTIASDANIEAIKNKVSEIVLTGRLSAPKDLVPLIQYLSTVNSGEIKVLDDE